MKRRLPMKLYGFNNLTKSLSFNIYDICYAKSKAEQKDYVDYISREYNSDHLTKILYRLTEMIGAKVLNVSVQDYDPQGASVVLLLSDQPQQRVSDTVLAHLDKSHLTVHTYPEYHPNESIATFRVDIDMATCGEITPLQTLNYLIDSFDSDIITMDYKVRGYTRDIDGKKLFIDHQMTSIQDYIDDRLLECYKAIDVNVETANLFHTKMILKEFDLQNYLFRKDLSGLSDREQEQIKEQLKHEMMEIYLGTNI